MNREDYAGRLRNLVDAPPWCFDFVRVEDDYLEIRGWALPCADPAEEGTFTVNGSEFDQVLFPLPWSKIGRLFWYWPRAGDSGFICRTNQSVEDLFHRGFATFQYASAKTLTPFNESHSYYLCDPRIDSQMPLPDTRRRRRVHGDALKSAFLLEGYATMHKLEDILRRITGRGGFSDFKTILDWGCGCGRVSRYLTRVHGGVTGVDIDPDNIEWCRSAFPGARFLQTPLVPPTPLGTSEFDLAFGVSVFTHLREKDQHDWLAELRRISKPGAILLMTTLGATTVCRAALSADLFTRWERDGFLDLGPNPFLSEVVADSEYYRNVFHTEAYIRQHWSQYFEILAFVPGVMGNHQDVVVLRNIK